MPELTGPIPQLIAPAAAYEAAWREARADWGPGIHEDGFGLRPEDDVDTSAGFAAWLRRLAADTDCTYRWIVQDGRVLGGIALRHANHPAVPWAGHLGYGLRPSARGQGHAVWAVREVLAEARSLGMEQVLAICERGNTASARTIEQAGGTLAGNDNPGTYDGDRLRRYIIRT